MKTDTIPLPPKKYNLLHFMTIVTACAPVAAMSKMLLMVVNSLTVAAQATVTALFIDRALAIFAGTLPMSSIYLPLIGTIALIGFISSQDVLNDIAGQYITINLMRKFRPSLIEKQAKLQYSHIENAESWELINRVTSDPVQKIQDGFQYVNQAIGLVITVVSLLFLIAAQVWWAPLVILAFSVPLFFLSIKSGQKVYEADKEAQKFQRRAKYLKNVLTNRDSAEERTLFGYSEALNKEWYEKYELSRKINAKATTKRFIQMKGSGLIALLISAGIVGVLIVPLAQGVSSVGSFIALSTATMSFVQSISWSLTWVMSQLAVGQEYLKDLTKFTALEEQDDALALPELPPDFTFESLEFRNVTFAYPDTDRLILKGLSFTLHKGKHYAFVGINGAGKTTITKLICGLYDNYEGDIFLNGTDIRNFSLSRRKAVFSVVYQDFARYAVTMEENIRLGDVLHKEKPLSDILSLLELDEAVENLADGLQTPLGKIKENAADLSGGEWQRVAIARSLYSDASLRMLDEPTAALDPVSESRVYQLFGAISKGKTTIFITHRLGAARLADEIIVLSDGAVAEQGSHEVLVTLGGIYAEMFASQRSWYQ